MGSHCEHESSNPFTPCRSAKHEECEAKFPFQEVFGSKNKEAANASGAVGVALTRGEESRGE